MLKRTTLPAVLHLNSRFATTRALVLDPVSLARLLALLVLPWLGAVALLNVSDDNLLNRAMIGLARTAGEEPVQRREKDDKANDDAGVVCKETERKVNI